MRVRFLSVCIGVLLLCLGTAQVTAQSEPECNVATLLNAWVPSTSAGAPSGVVYGYLVNLSNEADTLVSVSTDLAEAAELHQMSMGTGDVMQMQPAEGGVSVDAHDFQELKSGGLHIMLVNLKQPLEAGKSITLTLQFQQMGEISVTVPIIDAMAEEAMGGMSSEMTAEPSLPADMDMPSMPVWPEACSKLHMVGGWARPTTPGMPNGAAYGLLVNFNSTDETLLSVTTPVAESAELHEMIVGSNDVMQMQPIEGGLVIPAGGGVMLQPGGKHIMLFGVKQELAVGTSIDLMLNFEKAGEINLTIPVHEPPTEPMSMQ